MQDVQIGAKPFNSLSGAGAVGVGAAVNLENCYSNFSLQTNVVNAATAVSVTLEGSLNGTNWFVLATSTSVTGDMQFSTGRPVSYVRANLGTLTTAAGATVSAWIGASG